MTHRHAAAATLMLITLLTHSPQAPAQASQAPQIPALQGEDFARYQALTRELRCLVCQNETIADSTAPLAQDLRGQVERQIKAGRSNAQIVEYLTNRYGDYVLYRPPLKPSTWLLWIGPFALLALALGIALRLGRNTSKATTATVDEAAVARILAETQSQLKAQDASEPRA